MVCFYLTCFIFSEIVQLLAYSFYVSCPVTMCMRLNCTFIFRETVAIKSVGCNLIHSKTALSFI